jgi:hypothetical protein
MLAALPMGTLQTPPWDTSSSASSDSWIGRVNVKEIRCSRQANYPD